MNTYLSFKRQHLLDRDWEQVLTEEDGCETWRFPFELREHYRPLVSMTRHFWDLEEAVELQDEIDRLFGPHGDLRHECQRSPQDS